jgi:hypothetical protein
MKRTALLLIAFCTYVNAYAQYDFREGFYITHSQDTIKGFISYEESMINLNRFRFKKQLQDLYKNLYPADAKAYGFKEDKFFESAKLAGDSSKVFLEVLVKGIASLYKYDGRFFIKSEKDGALHELLIKDKVVQMNGKTYRSDSKYHIGVLKYVMSDCAEVGNEIASAKVLEKPLTKLVIKYNNCVGGPQQVFKETKAWVNVSWEPGIGMVHSRMDETYWDPFKGGKKVVTRGAFQDNFRPFAGVTADLSSPRVIERISLQLGLFYFQSEYLSAPESKKVTEINLKELKLPFSIRYSYKIQQVIPYVNAGGAFSVFLSDAENTVNSRTFVTAPNQFGTWGGVGAQRKLSETSNAYFEIRYERTNTLVGKKNKSADTKLNIHHFYTLIGLKF